MPVRIIEHNTSAVYLANVGGQSVHRPELQSVTFADENGTPHTVHAHVDAYDGDPQAIVDAYYAGTLTVDAPPDASGTLAPDQPAGGERVDTGEGF